MTAAHVLGLPELLESILIEVADTKTLLLAQRVNKTWKATITRSKVLQQLLFFEYTAEGPFRYNPLLHQFEAIRVRDITPSNFRRRPTSNVRATFKMLTCYDFVEGPGFSIHHPPHSSARKMYLASGSQEGLHVIFYTSLPLPVIELKDCYDYECKIRIEKVDTTLDALEPSIRCKSKKWWNLQHSAGCIEKEASWAAGLMVGLGHEPEV